MTGRIASVLSTMSKQLDIAKAFVNRVIAFRDVPSALRAEATQIRKDMEDIERKHEKHVTKWEEKNEDGVTD